MVFIINYLAFIKVLYFLYIERSLRFEKKNYNIITFDLSI